MSKRLFGWALISCLFPLLRNRFVPLNESPVIMLVCLAVRCRWSLCTGDRLIVVFYQGVLGSFFFITGDTFSLVWWELRRLVVLYHLEWYFFQNLALESIQEQKLCIRNGKQRFYRMLSVQKGLLQPSLHGSNRPTECERLETCLQSCTNHFWADCVR